MVVRVQLLSSPTASQMALYTTTGGNVGSETYTERVRIDNNGKVAIGIGTTDLKMVLYILEQL